MLLSFASFFNISTNSFLLMLYQSPFLSFTFERVGFSWTSYIPGVGVVQGGEGPESLSRFHNPWKDFLFYCYTDKLLLENMAYLCELLYTSEANWTEVHFGFCPAHPSFCTHFFFQVKNVDLQGKPFSSRKCTFWDLLPPALLVILSMLLFTCFYETLFWATLRLILEAAEYICSLLHMKMEFSGFCCYCLLLVLNEFLERRKKYWPTWAYLYQKWSISLNFKKIGLTCCFDFFV